MRSTAFAFVLAVSSIAGFATLFAGCPSGSFNGPDSGVPDMSMQLPMPDMLQTFNFDLSGLDLAGLSNCKQLNMCEAGATPAQALMCEMNATPPARAKEAALQSCFLKHCPVIADMGAGVCAPNDMGQVSAACQTCVKNTYAASMASCSPMTAPECTMCLFEATECFNDQ
jgi:hypothetical protein